MSVWHGDSHKKKPSGGRKRSHRKKRRFERGSFPTETTLGERKLKKIRRRGGNLKTRAFSEKQASISNPATGKTEKTEILRVVQNPASIDYDRRGVITKGTIIETKLGLARVTSRPGQHGLINAILMPKETKK
ncbi:MAG: 30S ribosomal protein S8e [Candidatus Bathyarchaeota archaeon]|nr:30S ribosomal protein S8e [Candidatus Bathyarchaeota archaeon]MDH5495216.1 30S ribosomal protein S8e [Candidatus Bathyarchaeota archaeon]